MQSGRAKPEIRKARSPRRHRDTEALLPDASISRVQPEDSLLGAWENRGLKVECASVFPCLLRKYSSSSVPFLKGDIVAKALKTLDELALHAIRVHLVEIIAAQIVIADTLFKHLPTRA